jgi:hypothetical protein
LLKETHLFTNCDRLVSWVVNHTILQAVAVSLTARELFQSPKLGFQVNLNLI